ncbi:hypothetical protein [Pseudomonas trivialis]|uniref:Uncharacterized protein n=1 Tax=Pseudomonas trivialis TaxID=200450 RepID=A0A0R2ZNW9_9PSED|nr:hypothetical protein [Pseudomonas trivialis]KRP62426.1 hypothetical protein TU79_04665 [Pseudomonas trivialis]SDS33085.1 hypothetical protein SAMN04490205_2189 [Pseudomonas trivialis]
MNAIPVIRSFAQMIEAALYQHAENRWAAPHLAECASPCEGIVLAGTHSLHDALAMEAGDVLVVGSNRMKSYARSIGLALDSLLEGAHLVAASRK